jgi:hypothetical protein
MTKEGKYYTKQLKQNDIIFKYWHLQVQLFTVPLMIIYAIRARKSKSTLQSEIKRCHFFNMMYVFSLGICNCKDIQIYDRTVAMGSTKLQMHTLHPFIAEPTIELPGRNAKAA